jgi:hypothetical protein
MIPMHEVYLASGILVALAIAVFALMRLRAPRFAETAAGYAAAAKQRDHLLTEQLQAAASQHAEAMEEFVRTVQIGAARIADETKADIEARFAKIAPEIRGQQEPVVAA